MVLKKTHLIMQASHHHNPHLCSPRLSPLSLLLHTKNSWCSCILLYLCCVNAVCHWIIELSVRLSVCLSVCLSIYLPLSFTNPFLHSIFGSIWTDFTNLGIWTDLWRPAFVCFSFFFYIFSAWQHRAYMLSALYAIARLSVCLIVHPSVCRMGASVKNSSS